MKRFFLLLILLPLLFACSNEGNTNNGAGKYTVKLGGNTYSTDFVFDSKSTQGETPSVAVNVSFNGAAVYYYRTQDKTVCESENIKSGDVLFIPTNGCLALIEGATASEQTELLGYEFGEFIPIGVAASVTDMSGRTGFLLSHKDPISFDGVGAALISSNPTASALPENGVSLHASRGIKGYYTTKKYGVEKTSSRYFTYYLADEYAIACASAFMRENEDFLLVNSSLVSPYGTDPTIAFGDDYCVLDGINPEKATDGVFAYDERSGLSLSPEREGEFLDVLVFDGVVMHIADKSTRIITPYPNGYLLSFNGAAAVEKAASLSVGDRIEPFLFEPITTPKSYVLLSSGDIVETVFFNETRTGIALAVIYDEGFVYDSTNTNVWGVELGVDKDGKVVALTEMNVADSGNMNIPEGGFVLSVIGEEYRANVGRMKIGDTATRVEKNGFYFARRLDDAVFFATGEGEYLSVYDDKTSVTPVVSNAFELVLDKDGFVVETKYGGGTTVPKGGFVVSGIGVKNTELVRFYKEGCRVIFDEENGAIYLFAASDALIEEYDARLESVKATFERSLEKLIPLDYKHANELIATASSKLEQLKTEPAAFFEAVAAIEELENISVPSLAVQDRAAWVVGYDVNAADVKKTVSYAKSLGLNTLILSPYRDSYALFDTKNEHLSRHPDLPEGVDILELYVDECHAQGMKLIFMHCCFTTEKPSNEYPESHYVNYFGDKLLISKTGRDVAYFYDSPSYTLNPFDDEVRQFTLDVIEEVIENYDVDGIQLDYIRFPLPTYYQLSNYEDHGYNDDILAAFMKEYNTNVNPKNVNFNHEIWGDWCQFRQDIITSFVGEVKKLTDDGGLPLTCTCFADANDREKYVFQDVEAWAKQGLIYGIYPMIYSATLEGQEKYGDEIRSIIGNETRLVLGIGTYDGETNEVIRDQVLYSFELGSEGNSIFALEYIRSFDFDATYRDMLYRTPAVTTDDYGKTAKGYSSMLRYLVEKTYEFRFEDEDYSSLLEAIDAIDARFGSFDEDGKTKGEKAEFWAELAEALRGLVDLVDETDGARTHFEGYVETLALSAERTEAAVNR